MLLPTRLAESLRARSEALAVSRPVMLLTAAYALLYRYTGIAQVRAAFAVTGTPADAAALRTLQVAPEQTFSDLLKQVASELPSVNDTRLPADLPCRLVLAWPENGTCRAGDPTAADQSELASASVLLELSISDASEGLRLELDYNLADLAGGTRVSEAMVRFAAILEGILADPAQLVSQLPLLTMAERRQILVTWNATAVPMPIETTVHRLVEAQVRRTPDAVAIVFDGKSWTYSQLNARANRLAYHLRELGAGPGTLVGVCVDRSLEMVAAVLAVLKAGAAYVPLDPAYPPDRLRYMLEDSAAPLLLTQRHLADRLPQTTAQAICLDADWSEIPAGPEDDLNDTSGPDDLAYVIYTSGSTGKPKGVEVMHRGVVNFLTSMRSQPGIAADDILLSVTTLCFDIAGLELFLPLIAGARCVLVSREIACDGKRLLNRLLESRATILQATPATWRMLLDSGWSASHLVKGLCGGEAMPPALARQLQQRLPLFWNVYGPTETTIWSTLFPVDSLSDPIPIGRPLANTQCYILDPGMQPVPAGAVGELYIGGAGVARGYHNRPDLTAQRFVPDPFCDRPGGRLYKTGDLARYRPDGNIEYLGRRDQQVKIRGFRIELGEIEQSLLERPGVRQAVVVPHEQGPHVHLMAYVVADPAMPPDPADLRLKLKASLPTYMVPAAIVLIEALPQTPNGKIDRRALQALPLPTFEQAVAPRDESERQLVEIWKRLLRLSSIGVTQDFFESGGDSLLAVSLALEVEKAFGKQVPLTDMLPTVTVEKLARLIREKPSPRSLAIALHAEGGSRPPLFCLPGHGGHCFTFRGLAGMLDADQPVYGLNLPGVDGQSEAEGRVEDIAAALLDDVRRIQPAGPYYLAGYSFGGLVAMEMAQQLKEEGEETALLVLFDTAGEDYPQVLPFSARMAIHARSLLALPLRQKLSYLGDRVRHTLRRVSEMLRRRKRTRLLPQQRSVAEMIEEVEAVSLDAEFNYEYRPYDGRTLLFRADNVPSYVGCSYEDQNNGWAGLLSRLEVCHLPCHHLELFKSPTVDVLARLLQKALHGARQLPCEMATADLPSPAFAAPLVDR